jgi:hypothetical protein
MPEPASPAPEREARPAPPPLPPAVPAEPEQGGLFTLSDPPRSARETDEQRRRWAR